MIVNWKLHGCEISYWHTSKSSVLRRLGRCTYCEVPLQVVEGVRGLNIWHACLASSYYKPASPLETAEGWVLGAHAIASMDRRWRVRRHHDLGVHVVFIYHKTLLSIALWWLFTPNWPRGTLAIHVSHSMDRRPRAAVDAMCGRTWSFPYIYIYIYIYAYSHRV